MVIDMTSVCKEYTRKGLAHKMTEFLLAEAKRRQFPLVVSESTSAYTRKNKVSKFGFALVKVFEFTKYFESFSSMSDEMKAVHSKAYVLAKRL